MTLIENPAAFISFAGFAAASICFAYIIFKSEGYGDFSIGISYLDLYSLILILVPLTAASSYFMMSLGLGTSVFSGVEINWLRYFEWGVSTPILVAGISILSQSKKLTINAMILDLAMILLGFTAIILPMPWKILAFSLSSLAFIVTLYLMLGPMTKKAEERPKIITRLFKDLRNLIIILWLLYPLVWLFSIEGFGLISETQSFAAFTALDLVSKIGYAFLVLRNLEEANQS